MAFAPGAPFFPDRSGSNYLRLCYSLAGEEEIREGVRRLANALTAELERTEST